MAEAGIISKQPSKPKYKKSGNKSIIALNYLKRNFNSTLAGRESLRNIVDSVSTKSHD
jgi:hypothetical protein